jgi:hypothetical protein
MRILGIDCATVSLAISIVDFNEKWKDDLAQIKKKYDESFKNTNLITEKLKILNQKLVDIASLIDKIFTLKYVNVFNLLPGEAVNKASIERRMSRLKGAIQYIKHVNTHLSPKSSIEQVLVEYQMNVNDKSRSISNALIYEFCQSNYDFAYYGTFTNIPIVKKLICDKINVSIVGPALKGKVFFGLDGRMSNFRKRYMSNYNANKAHTKYNLIKWLKTHNCMSMLTGIPKKNIDDVADSFIMIYGWVLKNYTIC